MNTIQFIADCLAQTHLRLMATCEGLTAEQVAWRPAPTANNIGFILWRLTRNEDSRLTGTAGRRDEFEAGLWASDSWYERFGQPVPRPTPATGWVCAASPSPRLPCCCPMPRQ